MRTLLFSILLFLMLTADVQAEIKYDSLSWYDKHKIEYASWTQSGIKFEYRFYSNGHVQDITRTNSGRLLSRYEFFPNGERKFDTICTENYYNWSWTYYPNGARKRFVQEQFYASYSSSHTRFQLVEWDTNGEVSHLLEKDEQNNIAADESYPFVKYHRVRLHQVFGINGQLAEHGFYTENPISRKPMKQGGWVTYYLNGKLNTIGLFIDDKPCGIHYAYDSNGKLLSVKNYLDGKETAFEENELTPSTTGNIFANYPTWQWKKFTTDGLVAYAKGKDTVLTYIYRGAIIVSPVGLSQTRQNQLNLEFGFPVMQWWSSYTQYRVEYQNSKIVREHEILNGSWTTNRIYHPNGAIAWAYNCSSRQTSTYSPAGLLLSCETRYGSDDSRIAAVFPTYGGLCDSTLTFDAEGNIATSVVYGLYGQKFCSRIYSKGKIISTEYAINYARMYVTVAPGKTFEIIDDDVYMPGYYEIRNTTNRMISKGTIDLQREGQWIEYDPTTGRKLLVQNYSNGTPKAKGKYEEYYPNGNPKTKGTYGDNQQQVGVWKTYDSKGRLSTRARYKHGETRGLEYCNLCCPDKRGRFRWQITIHTGKIQWRLRKCRSRVKPSEVY